MQRIEVPETHEITIQLPEIGWQALRESWLADNPGARFVEDSPSYEKWASNLAWIGARDNHLFTLDRDSGAIWLRQQLDFEKPVDTLHDPKYGGNNIYELLLRERFDITASGQLSTVHLDVLIEVAITDMPEIA